MGELKTIKETAVALGVSVQHVRGLIRDDELDAVNVGRKDAKRKSYRVSPEEIDRFLGRSQQPVNDSEKDYV